MWKTSRSALIGLVIGVSAALAGCGSSSSPTNVGAKLECASIDGPIDAVQGLLIEQIAAGLADVPQLGEALAGVVTSTAFLLDLVDALAAFSTELLLEQDPAAAGAQLAGVGQSVQCFAVGLIDSLEILLAGLGDGPLAGIPGLGPVLEILLTDLSLLLGDVSAGLSGELRSNIIGELAGRLVGIANNLVALAQNLGSAAPSGAQAEVDLLGGLLMLPATLLGGVSELLNGFAALDAERSVTGLLGIVSDVADILAGLSPLPGFPGDTSLGALDQALNALSGGLAIVLTPIFDIIGAILPIGNKAAGTDGIFAAYLGEGVLGSVDPVNVAWMKGGVGPDGVERPALDALLAGIPILGDLLAAVLNFDGLGGGELVRALLLGDGTGLLPTLGGALAQVPGVPDLTPTLTLVGDVLSALLVLDVQSIPVVQNVLELVLSGGGANLVGGLVGNIIKDVLGILRP
jgi:hypothetical protein